MPSEMREPARERVRRWLEASPTVFRGVRRVLDERDELQGAMAVSQQECQRLRQQCDGLREEARHLHAALGRLQKERTDAAHWVTTMLQEAAAWFPLTPPPA
jgi:chromosome segregation ATPase